MDYATDHTPHADAIATLFTDTFAASEGPDEGALIGGLVRRLLADTPDGDLTVFTAREDGMLVGGILFTRLTYDGDSRRVVLMAPVAVATRTQGRGIGQALITHGLDSMRQSGADIAVTYGDPAYYGRVGFQPVTQDVLAAPYDLQFPEGWQAQSLTEAPLTPVKGPARCVAAFDDPVYW